MNNKELFPLEPSLCWTIFGDYLFMLNKWFDIEIFSFVMMPNHVHLLCRDPGANLSVAMAIFMRETSKEISRFAGRINRIWGSPFFSSVIGNHHYFLHAYKYTYRNPVAARLCERVEDYPWSTLAILLGHRRDIIPLQYDDTLFNDVTGTLRWLNEDYNKKDADTLRHGLHKKYFRLPVDRNTRKPSPLETGL